MLVVVAMKTVNFVRFVCLACAWYSVRAVDVEARGEQPTGDDPIQVIKPLGVKGPGIKGCLATAPSFKIRVQSLKTSNGTVYSRQLVTSANLPCFENSATKNFTASTNIAACAEAAAKEGLNSFRWEGGKCTAYLAWRPQIRTECMDGGSKVVYVVKKPLTPFNGGKLVASGMIRYGVPQTYVDITTHYDYCGFGVAVSKGHKLLINGTKEVNVPEGTTAFSMDYKILCSGSMNLSLWSLDAGGKVNSNEVNLTIARESSRWFGLPTGACLYFSPMSATYPEALNGCKALGLPPLFFAKVDGEAAAFLRALEASGYDGSIFYVGIEMVNGIWTWLGGLVQPPIDRDVWGVDDQSASSSTCAVVEGMIQARQLTVIRRNTKIPYACYFSKM